MRTGEVFNQSGVFHSMGAKGQVGQHTISLNIPRKTVIGSLLLIALVAFEVFNFDTTRYALQNLLGDVRFVGISWSAILAIAFCAIDFAGLTRLFTPERGQEEPKAVWYLMGAWLLGATMNAIMTWWAVSLTLLTHSTGNEILSREQLLQVVPVFVAALVWLTRILFIGALSVAGEHLFDLAGRGTTEQTKVATRPITAEETKRPMVAPTPASNPESPSKAPAIPPPSGKHRTQQRPPIPSTSGTQLPTPMRAEGHQ